MAAVSSPDMHNDDATTMTEDTSPSLRDLLNVADRSAFRNDAVRRSLRSDPSAASIRSTFRSLGGGGDNDDERLYPLFAAIALGASPDVVRALYEACPKALGETTRAGLTALHLACQHRASVRVVEFLLHHTPSHVSRKSKNTWSTPLHVACASGVPVEVIRALIVKHHGALGEHDRRGNTPLHCACLAAVSSVEVIRLLVAFKRAALDSTNHMGMAPLHAACLTNARPQAIRLMLEQHPSGASAAAGRADSHGNVAAHYASSHGANASASAIRMLLKAYPACAEVENKLGHTAINVAGFDANTPVAVLDSLRAVGDMMRLGRDSEDGLDGEAAELHRRMRDMGWDQGADLVLDARPGLVHWLDLDDSLLPCLLRKVGWRKDEKDGAMSLSAIFAVVRGVPDLMDCAR